MKVADRAIGRMFELTAAMELANEPSWIYWWSEAEAHNDAGMAALALDNPRLAENHFRQALTSADQSFPRTRTVWLLRLAAARARLGELEGALRTASEAGARIRRSNYSHLMHNSLVEFRRAVAPHANTAAVKDFDAKFADLLRAAPGVRTTG